MAGVRTKMVGTLVGVAVVVAGLTMFSAEEPHLPGERSGNDDEPVIVRWDVMTDARADILVTSNSTVHGGQKHYEQIINNGSPTGTITLAKDEVISLTVTASMTAPPRYGLKRIMCSIDVAERRLDTERKEVRGQSVASVACQARVRG